MPSKFTVAPWNEALDTLKGPLRESLARRMLVSGGSVLRDEAKERARESQAQSAWNISEGKTGSHRPGTLADAVYLAKNDRLTTGTTFVYSVSWNQKQAFWGKFLEFGYTRVHVVVKDKDGNYWTRKKLLLAAPIRVPARPFLGPAYDAKIEAARAAMIERGRIELPILLREASNA